MDKKSKHFHIPGLHIWFSSYRLDKESIDKILETIQEFIEILRKKL